MYGHEKYVSRSAVSIVAAAVAAALVLAPQLAVAKDDAPANLGGGLRELVAPSTLARSVPMTKSAAPAARASSRVLEITHPIEYDTSGRVLVRISLDGKMPSATVLQTLTRVPNVAIAASNLSYRVSMVEAWVPTTSLRSIATMKGVSAVVASSPARTHVGMATTQGIVQHRIDKIPKGIDGNGITVGVLSDSYDTGSTPVSAALDISTGDLPGPGNPLGNAEPVVVLADSPEGIDEGRAMLQIVHDIAPKARLGFATAEGGSLRFAENIRSLAGLPGAPRAVPGFKADVIVDDIAYFDEPFFQDGLLAQTVDEVAAAGVAYFSSAGNEPATASYEAVPNIVPGAPASWAGTNLDFTNVPASLYAGGFHNFAPSGTVDIAQTVQFSSESIIDFQWNEPFDPQPPIAVGPPLAQGKGTVPSGGVDQFTFSGTAGQLVQIFVDADNTTTGNANPDLTLDLLDPQGNEVAYADTNTVPESLLLELPATGTYTVAVGSFTPEQFGDYAYRVQPVKTAGQVVTDYNLLFFTTEGQFVGALNEANRLTGRPLEFGGIPEATLQVVIARANDPGRVKGSASRIRYVAFGDVAVQEYFSYLGPMTFGHSAARGAMGVAAYPFFAPFVPEGFTSPGPSVIYFGPDNRPLAHPEIRAKPDMAAMDGANTTFFGDDSDVDADALPNFFGTSASAPHAAGIAALMLDAAGGRGGLKPGEVRRILQSSAFRHDLDPFLSSGIAFASAGKALNAVIVSAFADSSSVSQVDPNALGVRAFGPSSLSSFSIDGSTANPTQTPRGLVFDTRSMPVSAPPGQPFVIGRAPGFTSADVTASYSRPASPLVLSGQWKQLDLLFSPGAFTNGDKLSFGVDRDEAQTAGPLGEAAGGNSADLLGEGVLLPSGALIDGGAKFFGKFANGGAFSGTFHNRIGKGYSPLDGYGFINAEAAIEQVMKTR